VARGRRVVQHLACKRDHLGAAHGVVALALFSAAFFADGVCAIQRVIQAAPAGVGGVQCIAGVQDGHHQLGAGLRGQFVVHIGGGGLHLGRLGHQVADLFEKAAVGHHVLDGAGVGLVPGVQLGLQAVTLGQQGDVARGQVGHDGVKALPEGGTVHARAGQHLVFDKAEQGSSHLQAVDGGAVGHGGCLEQWLKNGFAAWWQRCQWLACRPLYCKCLKI
jgi:hypothetical protein